MTNKRDLLEVLQGINAFEEFEDALRAIDNTKLKGDLFEIFCQAYLLECHPQEFKSVKRLEDIDNSAILRKLNLRISRDYGIDLVAVTETGNIWTIQAKFRSRKSCRNLNGNLTLRRQFHTTE